LVILGIGSTPSAFAQLGYNYPAGTFSPWMNMFQRQPGPLDNYHSYVQPAMQLQKTVAQQNAALQQQNRNLQALNRQVWENDRDNSIPVTGTGSVFMSYSHYYSGRGAGGGSASSARTPSHSAPLSHASSMPHASIPTASSVQSSAMGGR
jgi:hypothetical protein